MAQIDASAASAAASSAGGSSAGGSQGGFDASQIMGMVGSMQSSQGAAQQDPNGGKKYKHIKPLEAYYNPLPTDSSAGQINVGSNPRQQRLNNFSSMFSALNRQNENWANYQHLTK